MPAWWKPVAAVIHENGNPDWHTVNDDAYAGKRRKTWWKGFDIQVTKRHVLPRRLDSMYTCFSALFHVQYSRL